jgi:hypothetical protein
MITDMLALGRSPYMFYFKPDEQARLLPSHKPNLVKIFNEKTVAALLGLKQSVSLTTNNKFLLMADFGIRWVYNDQKRTNPQGPFSILDALKVELGAFEQHVCIPQARRNEVEKALKQRTFHVKYFKGKDWVEQQRAKGKTDEWIRKNEWFEKRNQRVLKDPNESQCIVWSADESHDRDASTPNSYTFPFGEVAEITVCEYFQRRWGLRLQYPKMPLVRISKSEYYPVELLYQGEHYFFLMATFLPITHDSFPLLLSKHWEKSAMPILMNRNPLHLNSVTSLQLDDELITLLP